MSDLLKSRMDSKENGRAEMRILPMYSLKRVFEDWVFGIDCLFREFDSWPLSAVLDKTIDMVKTRSTQGSRSRGFNRERTE